jgi:hypothetical protein
VEYSQFGIVLYHNRKGNGGHYTVICHGSQKSNGSWFTYDVENTSMHTSRNSENLLEAPDIQQKVLLLVYVNSVDYNNDQLDDLQGYLPSNANETETNAITSLTRNEAIHWTFIICKNTYKEEDSEHRHLFCMSKWTCFATNAFFL